MFAPHRQSADSRNEKAGPQPTLIVITSTNLIVSAPKLSRFGPSLQALYVV
jgi:hypothetical protein